MLCCKTEENIIQRLKHTYFTNIPDKIYNTMIDFMKKFAEHHLIS